MDGISNQRFENTNKCDIKTQLSALPPLHLSRVMPIISSKLVFLHAAVDIYLDRGLHAYLWYSLRRVVLHVTSWKDW